MKEEREVLKVELAAEGGKSIKVTYPSNSHKDKEEAKKEKVEKKVEKIISGKVVTKKKSLGKKFMESFIGEDVKDVKSYILYDVLIPSAKDTISDIVHGITDTIQGSIEVSLFGERRSRSSRGRRDSNRSYVSYDKMSSRDKRDRDRDKKVDDRPNLNHAKNRSRHVFDDIILESRAEADEVRDSLIDLIEEYGQATVADLYDLVGISSNYTDDKWGWENLASSSISRIHEGYVLNLPKTIPLD
jgi:hypothetical protein